MSTIQALHPLRALYPFKLKLHNPAYSATEVVGPGGDFFDILVKWTDPDGSVVFNDIGGQGMPGFDPEQGHGSVWRYTRDGRLEPIVAPGGAGRYAFISIIRGEDNFFSTKDIFIIAQGGPGRDNASQAHVVLRVAPGANKIELLATVPNTGPINNGHAGAMMPGAVGRPDTAFDGQLIIYSMMNCTLYTVAAAGGEAKPLVTMMSADGRSIMPIRVGFAPKWWGEHGGELVVMGIAGASFTSARSAATALNYYKVGADGQLTMLAVDPLQPPLDAVTAPAEFGPYAGHLFWADEGDIQLGQIEGCDQYADGLPYSGQILHRGPDGETRLFADDFYGSYTSLTFDRDRLIVGQGGLSYSTGEFHEPDASLLEIRYKG